MIFDALFQRRSITSIELEKLVFGDGEVSSGVRVSPETAARHGTVFACIRVIAESVAQLPLHLYRESGREKQKATEHPLYWLLHLAPNDFQTAQEFWEMAIFHLLYRGNFVALPTFSDGKLLELLPFHPDWVTIKDEPRLGEYSFEVRYPSGQGQKFRHNELFHLRGLTLDGKRGVTPITYAAETIGLSMATEKHAATYFSQSANPGGFLTADGEVSQDARDRINKSWDERHKGVEKAHRYAILEAGLKFQQVGSTAKDAQLLEARKLSRVDICSLFRVQPTMIQDNEKSTYSNNEQQAQNFVDYCLTPYLVRIESRVRKQLLSDKDRRNHFAKFNVDALLRGDSKTRAEVNAIKVQNGALSPNEWRARDDENPRAGGDIYLTPANMLIDGKLPAQGDDGTTEPTEKTP